MTNAWSLLYDELYGDKEMTDKNNTNPKVSDDYDPITGFNTSPSLGYDLGGSYEMDNMYDLNIPEEFQTPPSPLEDNSNRKYKEDESIKALQDYISTTYGGHYTSEQNNVQTLDLIESVGDAEAFCRSNAIKYLSRYDKKGQAKRDILKALHYSLLLYHFSGQLNETPTRGYETF